MIPFLLCYGSPGNGKTHLCNALAIVLNENKIGLRLYAVADLLSDLKMAMADNSIELKIRFLKTIPALILDDYGVNYGSEWEFAKIDEIFTARFRDERITVMTTNLDFDSLPERIKSRFKDSELSVAVLNNGLDQRPLKAKAK
jgi:primosomal protein DnaI